ncbi:MAG: DUF6428 family protein [Vicingaceae bacterium]|nr:DUF6428 family protein [Vicingaceae bacterium]
MKLSEFKDALTQVNELTFVQPDGMLVPSHFHVTEIGKINKHFIDCGGTMREENVVNFQLWVADDIDHRFAPEKLLKVIAMSEEKLGIIDAELEVEYQSETVGKFDLIFDDGFFKLQNKFTDCLAKDNCGIPETKQRIKLADIQNQNNCAPGSGCC